MFITIFMLVIALNVAVSSNSHIDYQKAKADSLAFSLVSHVQWPDKEKVDAKKVDIVLLEEDVVTLTNVLARVIRKEHQPSVNDLKNISAAKDLYGVGVDYLLFKYRTQDGLSMEIQDGNALFVSVPDFRTSTNGLSDINNYVKKMAIKLLNYPDEQNLSEKISVFVSSMDIGSSKWGGLYHGMTNNGLRHDLWYANIGWWSDGCSVMFVIPKMAMDDMPKASQLFKYPARKFKEKKDKSKK